MYYPVIQTILKNPNIKTYKIDLLNPDRKKYQVFKKDKISFSPSIRVK